MLWWWLACTTLVDIQTEWKTFLVELPPCKVDADCAIIEPGCPLGCYTGVLAGRVADAEAVAAELVERYDNGIRPCVYECQPAPPLVICDSDLRCVLDDDPPLPPASE